MASTQLYSNAQEKSLMTELWDPAISEDIEAFVLFAFPWGKENTPLHNHKGPKTWQRDQLQAMTEHIRNNKIKMQTSPWIKDVDERAKLGILPTIFRDATGSGRGIGKSAETSWINLYMMSCVLGSTTITSANTETQLKSRTWAELGKWKTLLINAHWFDKSVLSLRPALWYKDLLAKQLKIDDTYYYAQAQLWSEENPDAFAGVHNENGVCLVFDEASGIPKPIWDVSEGFFTEPILHRYWFVFSNPRRNTGPFFSCFHKHRDYWRTKNIDSRTVEGTDKIILQEIVDKHGEDSDEARIEVKGQFPETGEDQFISGEKVNESIKRPDIDESWAPLIMGVDPARQGGAKTVIFFREGRNARVIPITEMKGADNMAVANKCAELIRRYNPDAVCIDAGNGTGIIDRLREMRYKVHEIWFGSKSSEKQWANKRTEMWGLMREWVSGACLPNHQQLEDDLKNMKYRFTTKTSRSQSKGQVASGMDYDIFG